MFIWLVTLEAKNRILINIDRIVSVEPISGGGSKVQTEGRQQQWFRVVESPDSIASLLDSTTVESSTYPHHIARRKRR